MNRFLLALIGLVGVGNPLAVECSHDSSKNQCHVCVPTRISSSTTITQSGAYCLTQDIVGSITIAASDVVLDLNSHLVDGNGLTYAIFSSGFNNITIKNGTVINSDNLAVGLTYTNSFVIENIQVYNSSEAVLLGSCNNGKVNSLYAYNNLNNKGAVVLVNGCRAIELFDVRANNNTKALPAAISTIDPHMGIIGVYNSLNIIMTDCTANNNTQTNNNNRFTPFVGLYSHGITLKNCQANNNSIPDTVTDILGFAPIHFRFCRDIIIEGCQTNENSLGLSQSFLRGIYVRDTLNSIIRNSQANSNLVSAFQPVGTGNDLTGIYLSALSGTQVNTVVSDCQACNNLVVEGGSGRLAAGDLGQVNGILVQGISDTAGFANRSVITDCQTSDNVMQTSAVFQTASGITVLASNDVVVTRCTANGNRGGVAAYGVNVLGSPTGSSTRPCRRVDISHCTANDTQSLNLAVGFFLGGKVVGARRSFSEDCSIVACQADRNTAANGCGIILQNARSCSIVDSEINRNTDAGVLAGPALGDPAIDLTPINSYCSLINSSAKENGSHGFELDVSSNNFLLEHNVSVSNGGAGFLDATNPLTNTYLSNYAAANSGPAYFLVIGNSIQLYTYTISAGTYGAPITGTATLTSLTNIQAIP